jgi:hypothetical protein
MRAGGLGVLALVLFATACPIAAQFPAPPAEQLKGTPVTPARLPDGRPNWNGFWVTPNGLLEVYRGPSGITGQGPGANRPSRRQDIPALKSPYKERYEEAVQKATAGELPDAVAACFPPGMPRMMGMVYGMEILQTPKIISITSEWQAATRRVWMDLEDHPPEDELDLTYAGHSIGRWEDDTLVVETVGIRDDVPLDFSHLPHSPKLKVTERFTQISPGVLVNDITIDDPGLFEQTWKYRLAYLHKPDLRLTEYVCLENNRNVDADGRTID